MDAWTDAKRIVLRIHLIDPFLLNLPQGSKNLQTPQFLWPIIFLDVLNDRIRFVFNQFNIYFSTYGTYTGGPHLGCHQIVPRRPIFSITIKRGQHVQKICSNGYIYYIYVC